MLSRLVRRSHMYLALFLTPWLVVYALSTVVMNHRVWLRSLLGPPAGFSKVRELSYTRELPPDATPKEKAALILGDLNMDGAHRQEISPDGARLVITRLDPVAPSRITFTPATGDLLIERQSFEWPAFLERMHRRSGYAQPYAPDRLWGFTVDVVTFALIFWSLSGLWLWWELKRTRLWGAASAAAGLLLFVFFLLKI
jgi:hypothetical protein